MANATNYTDQSFNPTDYRRKGSRGTSFLLLQTSDFILYQDGTSKILLESGISDSANYTKESHNPTDYTST